MALPWPLAGAGLTALPKPGAWMVRVKQALGVVILVTAGYYGYLGYSLFADRWVDPTAVASINALGAGEALDDTFTYQIRDEFGAVSNTATVSLHVQGLNDVASVSSETRSVTEGNSAADLDTSGQLTIVDPDPGQAQVVAQTNVHGTYGDFSIDANGAWTYVGNGAHNELAGGQQYSDSFTVQSLDGSADGTVTVLIDGSYETVNLTLTKIGRAHV